MDASPAKSAMEPTAADECPPELMQAIASEHDDTVLCSKYGEAVSLEDLEPSIKDTYMVGERRCGLNYKCCARRWKENARPNVWWG